MQDLVIGIDSSTTAVKAFAMDGAGAIVAEGHAALTSHHPEPDAHEQDAEQWWSALGSACRALRNTVQPARVAALAIANQRETFVLTDASCRPLRPAVLWMDHRCTAQVDDAVLRIGAERLHEISGKPACTTPSVYKLKYVLDREPELRSPTTKVLDVHAFLAWRLTGQCRTSRASADPTGLIDMEQGGWSPELCDWVELTTAAFPELVQPGETLGHVTEAAAKHCGLEVGVPVIAGAGDGQCAGLGAGVLEPGVAYLNLGTAVVAGVLAHTYQRDRAFRTLYGAEPGTFFLETDLQGGTLTLNWLKTLLGDVDLDALGDAALHLNPGSDGLVALPYWAGVMNPHWDAQASGVLMGLRACHGPKHFYRAIIEGIAMEQRLHAEGLQAHAGPIRQWRVMGGGSRSDLWCQILADTLNGSVVRPESSQSTALGAAILAAGSSLHDSVRQAAEVMTASADGARSEACAGGNVFVPGAHQPFYDALYRDVYRGMYGDLQGRMKRLWELRTSSANPASR